MLGVNLLCIFLHESSKAGWINQLNNQQSTKYFINNKFCEKQSLNTKMSDLK